jgi:hypothetical protein
LKLLHRCIIKIWYITLLKKTLNFSYSINSTPKKKKEKMNFATRGGVGNWLNPAEMTSLYGASGFFFFYSLVYGAVGIYMVESDGNDLTLCRL